MPTPFETLNKDQVLKQLILHSLDADKAENTEIIELSPQSALADALIVATGTSSRHVSSLADKLVERLKHAGFSHINVEGLPHADWVIVDAGDIIVHLFRPEVRAFYNIERMWRSDNPFYDARAV